MNVRNSVTLIYIFIFVSH